MLGKISVATGLTTTALIVIGATVALCLGHISEGTYVAMLAGSAVAAPATAKVAENIGKNGGSKQ